MNITQKFVLKNQVNKDGTKAILFRITCDRKLFYVNTGIKVHENFFHEKGYIRKSHPYYDLYNTRLKAIEEKLNIFIALHSRKDDYSFDDIKAIYKKLPVPVSENFHDYCKRILDSEGKKTLTKTTIKHHELHLKQLKEYSPALTFNQIDLRFLSDYEYHCRYVLNNSTNTIHTKLKHIRIYINKAIRDGIITDYVFKSYHLKTESTKPRFLSMEELSILEKYYEETKIPLHRKHLQYFLFACFSGLRFSDIKNLKWNSINDGWIMFRSVKTKQHISIPLNSRLKKFLPKNITDSVSILLKKPDREVTYKELAFLADALKENKDTEYIFNVPSNQKANQYLKDIQKAAGIKQKLTTHVARHTFATVCLNLDMPLPVVQKLLGHASIKTTEIYAKIIDKKLEEEMKKWDNI